MHNITPTAVNAVLANLSDAPGRHVAVYVGGPLDGQTTPQPIKEYEATSWVPINIDDAYFAAWPEVGPLKAQGVTELRYHYRPLQITRSRKGVWVLSTPFFSRRQIQRALAECRHIQSTTTNA